MKHLDEYRDAATAGRLARAIRDTVTRPWTLMEICGGQTHAIVRYGIDTLLPPGLNLVHGPGCPVCVTPVADIDLAVDLAARPEVMLCSYGDMLRVPGSRGDLLGARSRGGDVRMLYSPLDCLRLAREHPSREVVFFAVGFETTAPVHALVLKQAGSMPNLSMLVSQVRVPPAMSALLDAPDCRIQGFLAAGHVCTVMGTSEYPALAARHRVPIVVTGFEPVDLLNGILACVRQLEEGRAEVDNAYARVVRPEGNPAARALLEEVFEPADRDWRGLGRIPGSGLGLRGDYRRFDARLRFGLAPAPAPEPSECLAGQILQGRCKPPECPAFGNRCTPDHPLGAPMVSSEGACAAYHRYRDTLP